MEVTIRGGVDEVTQRYWTFDPQLEDFGVLDKIHIAFAAQLWQLNLLLIQAVYPGRYEVFILEYYIYELASGIKEMMMLIVEVHLKMTDLLKFTCEKRIVLVEFMQSRSKWAIEFNIQKGTVFTSVLRIFIFVCLYFRTPWYRSMISMAQGTICIDFVHVKANLICFITEDRPCLSCSLVISAKNVALLRSASWPWRHASSGASFKIGIGTPSKWSSAGIVYVRRHRVVM